MAITLKASVDTSIEEVVSTMVQKALQQEAMMLPKINDRSGEVRDGMDTLKIPKMDPLTVVDQIEGTDTAVETAVVATDDLVLDCYRTVAWELGDIADVQSKFSLLSEIVNRAAIQHASDIDNKTIAAMVAGVAVANDGNLAAGALSGIIAKDDVLELRKRMNDARIPQDERWLLVRPEFEKQLLAINEFVSAEQYGSAQAIQLGELGRLFGFRVAMTSSAELSEGAVLAFHRTGFAYASQRSVNFESERKILRQTTQYALTRLEGYKVLDAGKRLFRLD